MKHIGTNNLSTVKEMLLDERRLVTYVSLSKELCIHVNESKSLLTEILKELRQNPKKIDLSVNHIISGLLDDNRAHTAVCNETELSELQAKFKKVFFQHLYSLCVGNPSVDNVSLMMVNKFEDFPLCTGLIKSNLCQRKSAEETRNSKINNQDIIPEEKSSIVVKTYVKQEIKNERNSSSEGNTIIKTNHTTELKSKTELQQSPKKSISNGSSQKIQSKNTNKNQKGIAGFFNKGANTSAKKSMNGTQENTINKTNNIIKTEKMDVDEEADKFKKNGEDNTSKLEFNNVEQIKKTAKVDKKRKRIQHVSDSESEEEKKDPLDEDLFIEPDSEDEIPPTPLVNTVKINSGFVNPKKRRKIVDKTYTDEDGYILTKKEEIYESCSDNDEEINVKENIQNVRVVPKTIETSPKEKNNGIKNSKKKTNSPQKGKQVTLMNFFKKV
ncbi:unnamed protein product [Diatraea saccharalis]|uniref:DNA polymerase delta subunit 3 n=1 Tax=Diatraea saccharalis TaxID=40085 RepID=A0A9N9R0Y6_9NEOP|nr:unnamed protein product [Diatraea saccharalis]